MQPLVSAVIPTHRRPQLVVRAIKSVLAQTYSNIEIIVVIDGSDDETKNAVESLNHPSITCIATGYHAGPAEARNFGIRVARGIYVALLDDDDQWCPEKITKQMTIVEERGFTNQDFIISSRQFIVDNRSGATPRITPKLLYQSSDDLSEYLFDRRTPISRPGMISTSSVLFPRSLALRMPFPSEGAHEEMGWWLKCITENKIPLVMAEDALCIENFDATIRRNHTQSWEASLNWARKHHSLMSRVAFASLLSSTTAWRAKQQQGVKSLWKIARIMYTDGQPRLSHWLMLLAITILPLGTMDRWRRNR